MSVREDLANALASAFGADVAVYRQPPDVISVPAVVVMPGSPYQTVGTACAREVNLDLVAFVARTDEEAAYDNIDLLLDAIYDAMKTVPVNAAWQQASVVGPTEEIGGVSYLSATVSVVAYVP
jgi:hypothetical protein